MAPDKSGVSAVEDPERLDHIVNQNDVLKTQLMNMSLINELTRVLNSCTDLDGIIKTVLLGIQEIIGFDRVILFAIDRGNFALTPSSWVGINLPYVNRISIPLGFDGGEITDAIFLNRHIIVDQTDPELDLFRTQLESTSYLVIPLVSKATRKCFEQKNCNHTSCPAHGGHNPYCWSIPGSGLRLHNASEDEKRRECIKCACFKVEGVLWMDRNSSKRPIASDDISMLSAVINVAGIIIENFRMFNALELSNAEISQANNQLKVVNHDLQIAQAKINADLDRARKIQQGLLPQDFPDTEAFAIGAHYIPATAVGGDYYDVFEITKGTYGIVVADVSGHGISSALIMSMVKVLLKTYATASATPQQTLEKINATFLSEIKTDNFVTVFYGVLDTTAHTLSYTSAGHCPILIFDKVSHQSTQVKADGLFLGVFDDMMLSQSTMSYAPGTTRVTLYTDGLIESRNKTEEMFDISRLQQISADTLALTPRKTIEKIIQTQKQFCGNREPDDDITLLVIDF
jgi:serine phosphatase RsbU (regulator of sigma subunit)